MAQLPAGCRLRPAQAADVEAVLAFWLAAAEGTDRRDSAAGLHALLTQDSQALWLIEDEVGIAATLISGWDGWRASLYRLAVRPDRRRQGLARELLDAAEMRLAALGAARVDAMVLNGNELAHPTWAAQGYQPQPEWARWVKHLPTV